MSADLLKLKSSSNSVFAPASLDHVRLLPGFWQRRQREVLERGLMHGYRQLEAVGNFEAFEIAAGMKSGDPRGYVFRDSDAYKWLEAASFALLLTDEMEIRRAVDSLIDLLDKAQSEDGYINTSFSGAKRASRFTDVKNAHEIYCVGHLIQAAIAHHRATSENGLMQIAIRAAENLYAHFGPDGLLRACGHPECELALFELYRETGDRRWQEFADRMLRARGQTPGVCGGSDYYQDHLPVEKQTSARGHAVRALYLYAGCADSCLERSNSELACTLQSAWNDICNSKLYVTGGVGSRHDGESFGLPYELPNARAYAESCAAIAWIQLNLRLFCLFGETKYLDALERALYNGMLSGISLDATGYLYENPLENDGSLDRRPWFDCACCPPNLYRTILSVQSLIFSKFEGGVSVNLFDACEYDDGTIKLRIETNYPQSGEVKVTVGSEGPFELRLRIPSWCQEATLELDGETRKVDSGRLASFSRAWNPGDEVKLSLEMPVCRVFAHPLARENRGCVALQRGPLIYCAEGSDSSCQDIRCISIVDGSEFVEMERSIGNEPIVQVEFDAVRQEFNNLNLYAMREPEVARIERMRIKAIPYYCWLNRGPNSMLVWLPIWRHEQQ